MKKMIFILMVLLMPAGAFAAPKTVRVCNNSGQSVNVAVGWMDYTPRASGWSRIADGICKNLPSVESNYFASVYAFAIGDNGNEYIPNGGTYSFCIDPINAFTEKGFMTCKALDTTAEVIQSRLNEANGTNYKVEEVSNWRTFGAMSGFKSLDWEIR